MLDLLCILLLYTIQGCIQGLAFGTLPLLMMRNPAATEVHQSQFSLVGYPFSVKFLLAPLVDGFYWSRLGRRESWLLPLQLLSAVLLLYLSGWVSAVLAATPPEVNTLTFVMTGLVLAAAVGDIATDAWAAGRMSDSRASVCQTVGLTLGMEGSTTIFFLLKGRDLMEVNTLLQVVSTLAFVVLGIFATRMSIGVAAAADEAGEDGDEDVSVRAVLGRIWTLVRRSANLRVFLVAMFILPISGAHGAVLGVRYQKLGFTPEMFADYDLYLLPVSFVVMWLAGRLAQGEKILSALGWVCIVSSLCDIMQLGHFYCCQQMGQDATQHSAIRFVYIILGQVKGALATVSFVVKVAFFNRIAQKHQAIAGTVITFLASISNFGGQLPGTWVPLVAERAGLYALAASCMTLGTAALWIFWPKLQRLENMADSGW